jgi:hypothetical protein
MERDVGRDDPHRGDRAGTNHGHDDHAREVPSVSTPSNQSPPQHGPPAASGEGPLGPVGADGMALPTGGPPSPNASQPESTSEDPDRREESGAAAADARTGKRRNGWIWVSALLAVIAVGLLVWALTTTNELNSTQEQLGGAQNELATAQQELDSTQQTLDTTTTELDSTTAELEAAQQDVEELQAAQSDEGERNGGVLLTVGTFATMKSVYDDLAAQLGGDAGGP